MYMKVLSRGRRSIEGVECCELRWHRIYRPYLYSRLFYYLQKYSSSLALTRHFTF